MRLTLLAVALLMAITVWSHSFAGEAAVREIPEVTTLEQLEGQEPHGVAGGWEVRVGLGDAGADAGPWKLLYCLAKHAGEDKEVKCMLKGDLYGQFLGPVFFTRDAKAESVGKMAGKWTLPAEGLYCALILTAWEGTEIVSVVSPEGKVLTRATIKVEKPGVCYWQYFATWRTERPQGQPEWAAMSKAYAARPDFDGMTPLPPPAAGASLPGRIPAGEGAFPLKLSLENGAFVVQSATKVRDWADLHLLARWWVNGKPVVPARSDLAAMMQMGRRVSYAKEIKIVAGWPESLGEVKAGDKLGLQVLYSPAMAKPLPRENGGGQTTRSISMREAGVAATPLLSNRIEFAATDELLRARAGNPKDQ